MDSGIVYFFENGGDESSIFDHYITSDTITLPT